MNAPERKGEFRGELGGEFRVVGTRPVRPDGIDKVTGKALYGTDFVAPGMLPGAILRSPHPHARIRAIDTRAAEALAGVKAVVTGRDFTQASSEEITIGEAEGNAADLARNAWRRTRSCTKVMRWRPWRQPAAQSPRLRCS